jgi:hypothetical protein
VREPGTTPDAGQGGERGADGVGVGVVGVVDHAEAVGPFEQLHPPLREGRDRAQAGRDVREPDAGGECCRGHGGGVVRMVLAEQGQVHVLGRAVVPEVEAGAAQLVERGLAEPDVGVRAGAERGDARPGAGRHREHQGVVRVEHRDPVVGQRLDQLALGHGDLLLRPELPEVRAADVEHQ